MAFTRDVPVDPAAIEATPRKKRRIAPPLET
jgi:hypothetical protein